MGRPLLEIEGLRTHFEGDEGVARAVDALSLSIDEGEVVGLVGESGCGKSVTALSILRLLPAPAGRIISGVIRYRGVDLLALPEGEMRRVRGNEISMVFQEPMTALNPVLRTGEQIAEVFRFHRSMPARRARCEAIEMLRLVGIPDAEARAADYPHRLSGGMRQRVLLAIALACRPSLLLADEPTTALDVTIQAQILRLILSLRERFAMAVLLITHDLGVVAETADRVAVMYAGEIVEEAPAGDLFRRPRHPYTRALLRSVPRPVAEGGGLESIEGSVPSPLRLPAGCRFRSRCPVAERRCAAIHPVPGPRRVRCLLEEER